jgi:hypothetical protein
MASRRLTVAAIALLLGALPAWASPQHVALLTDITVDGPVDGDVVAFAGDVVLGPHARVSGNVVAFHGTVLRHADARVDGRALSISSFAGFDIVQAGEADPRFGPAVVLLSVGGWLTAATLLAFLLPGRLRYGVWLFPHLGVKVVVVGVLLYLTFIAACVAALGFGAQLAPPLIATLVVAFLAAKAVGLTILGGSLGAWLLRAVRAAPPLTLEVVVGVALLLLVRFIPAVGGLAWEAMSIVAVGAGLFTTLTAFRPASGALTHGAGVGRSS